MHKSKDSILVIMYICKHRPLVVCLFLDEYFEEEFEEDHRGCFVGSCQPNHKDHKKHVRIIL